MRFWVSLLVNAAVLGLVNHLDSDPQYQVALTTAIIVGLGATISTAGSLYAGSEEKKAREQQLQYLQSLAGQLGPLGLIMGGDNLRLLEGSINKLLDEEGLSYIGSQEQQNVGAFYAHLKPDEKAFLESIKAEARYPSQAEQQVSEFYRSLMAGEYLPGQTKESPFLTPLIESIQRNAREAADYAAEGYRSEGAKILGGLSGAGSFLPVYGDQMKEFQTRETDLTNQAYYQTYQDVLTHMVNSLGLGPTIAGMPFARLAIGQKAAALPREIRDVGIARSLAAFENRANRFQNTTMGLTGMVSNNPYPGIAAQLQWPSNAYVGNSISDLGNSLMLAGMLGGGGGGGGGTGAAVTNVSGASGFSTGGQAPTLQLDYGSYGASPYQNPFSTTPSTQAINPFAGYTTHRYY